MLGQGSVRVPRLGSQKPSEGDCSPLTPSDRERWLTVIRNGIKFGISKGGRVVYNFELPSNRRIVSASLIWKEKHMVLPGGSSGDLNEPLENGAFPVALLDDFVEEVGRGLSLNEQKVLEEVAGSFIENCAFVLGISEYEALVRMLKPVDLRGGD